MMDLRAAAPRARLARALFAVAAAVALAGLATFTVVLLVAPAGDAAGEYGFVMRGEDFILFAQPILERDDTLHARWRASPNQAVPERLMVIHGSEVARVLAGEAPQGRVLETDDESEGWGGFSAAHEGWIDVRSIERGPSGYVWPWACDACSDPRPTIVWMRGDAWRGASASELVMGSWAAPDPDAPAPPIVLEGVVTEHNFDEWVPRLQDATTAAVAITALLGAWWLVEAVLARRAAARAAPPPRPTTEDLLRLVEAAERYLRLLRGQFLAGGLMLALGLGVLAFAGMPALLAAVDAHFADPYYAYVLVGIAVPFLAALALVAWVAGYARLQRERDRWARQAAGVRATTARLLEP